MDPSLSRIQLLLPGQVRRRDKFSRPSQKGNERPFWEQSGQLGGRGSKWRPLFSLVWK